MKKRRTEDAIVAWTWKSFIENNGTDPEILLRLPMTKVCYFSQTTKIMIYTIMYMYSVIFNILKTVIYEQF